MGRKSVNFEGSSLHTFRLARHIYSFLVIKCQSEIDFHYSSSTDMYRRHVYVLIVADGQWT